MYTYLTAYKHAQVPPALNMSYSIFLSHLTFDL